MRSSIVAILAPLGVLHGCGTPWIEQYDGDWRRLTTTLNSNGSGNFAATIKPLAGESAMIVTVEPIDPAQDAHIRFLQISGELPYRADEEASSPQARSNAGLLSHTPSLNWPIAEADGFLRPGVTHKVQVGIVNAQTNVYSRGQARVNVVLKRDTDFSQGLLKVNVIFAGATGQDGDLAIAVEEAIAIWRNIYGNIGISLDVARFDYPPTSIAEAPGQGNLQEWRDISGGAPFGGVNVVLLEDIVAPDNIGQIFGFAGDIPGPLIATGTSAVAVNASLSAGPDGVFSATEVQLLAETMAHESGHYLGLFHPVERREWASWDALPDTPDCTNELSCIQSLGTNLMFPFPVCDAVSCVPQVNLTPQQAGVANRYTGVL